MSKTLNDLSKVKAIFQQRTIKAILEQQPIGTILNAVVKGELK